MKILVLGGTIFLGRYVVESALRRGHEVTLFNRGRHSPELFPEAERIVGHREGDLGPLKGRSWDTVIDTSGFLPRVVTTSAQVLSDVVAQYTFISSVSVYAQFFPGMDETAPVNVLSEEQRLQADSIEAPDHTTARTLGPLYSPLKAECEQVVEAAMSGRSLIIRSGLLVGPNDYSDRFTYWPHRVAKGGEVLAPDRPDRLLQFIDVRDLADWVIRLIEGNRLGIFNANGPDTPVTMGDVLEESKQASQSDARFTWVSESFLMESGVKPWIEVPLWVPEAWAGLKHVNFDKALAAGLTFRPLRETVRDTLAWDSTRPSNAELQAGLTTEREQELLNKWRLRN